MATPRQSASLAVASRCIAYGAGLETAIARRHARFTIEARDAEDNQMPHGGEKFTVAIHGASLVRAKIIDKEDGTYTCEYKTDSSGAYTVNILLHGAPLQDSPWEVKVLMPRPDAAQCIVKGEALNKAAARTDAAFELGFVDALGHPTHAEEIDVYVECIADDEADDDSLEQLIGTRAEDMATAWAREWAFLRYSEQRRLHVNSIKQQWEAEMQRRQDEMRQERRERRRLEAERRKAEEPPPPPPAPVVVENASPTRGGRGKKMKEEESKTPVAPVEPPPAEDAPESDEESEAEPEAIVATMDPPTYHPTAERIVGGLKPLIVRLSSELDSEQIGIISQGSKLQVIETRKAGDGCLRALVLLDVPQPTKPISPRQAMSPARTQRDASPVLARPSAPPATWVQIGEWPDSLPPAQDSNDDDLDSMASLGNSSVPQKEEATVFFRRKRELGAGLKSATTLSQTIDALKDDVISQTHGWVTAVRDGQELLSRVHNGLVAALRQQHITLWERRKSADKLIAKSQTTLASDGQKELKIHMTEAQRAEAKAGPSFAHELTSDPTGIGFAFGGVDPGILHARGQVVKFHTVRYSIGLAGRYRLHVGLRQQAVALPNSPFTLIVSPGSAHARSSQLPSNALPLMGTVCSGNDVSCHLCFKLSDRMGNNCTEGGASLKVSTYSKSSETGKVSVTMDDKMQTDTVDNGDGSYKITWQSQRAGLYSVNVTIGNVHLVGSPMEMKLIAGAPDIDKCIVSGEGIASAQAGRPALVCLYCKDTYDNLANRSAPITFGLVLVPRDAKDLQVKKETGEVLTKGSDGSMRVLDSMQFEGAWVGEQFEIRYTAEEAGEFGLHMWTDAHGLGKRKFLPGSPFSVRVSGVRASAAGSSLEGGDSYFNHTDNGGGEYSLEAGQRLTLNPRLRDEFGNASFATEGTLIAYMDMGDEARLDLPIRQLRELGKYELQYDCTKKGLHTVNVELHEEPISGSPFQFFVTPAPAQANKCRLYAPDDSPLVNTTCELRLEAVDKYGNRLDTGGSSINARAVGTGVSGVNSVDNKDGSYTLSFNCSVAGEVRVVVRLDNAEMAPITVNFVKSSEEIAEGKQQEEQEKKKKPAK